jgi:K+-transporting ATPase c subunit
MNSTTRDLNQSTEHADQQPRNRGSKLTNQQFNLEPRFSRVDHLHSTSNQHVKERGSGGAQLGVTNPS